MDDLEAHCDDKRESVRSWLKFCIGRVLRESSRAPDWSFYDCSEEDIICLQQPNRKGMEPAWIDVQISEEICTKLSEMANYIHGYRIIKDMINDAVYLRLKPKVRYSALRHVLDHMLHQWIVSKRVGSASFASTGSIGNKSAPNIVDHIYRYLRRRQYDEGLCGRILYAVNEKNRNSENEEQRNRVSYCGVPGRISSSVH